MGYKYMKIFHEGGKTMGIRTYSNDGAGLESGAIEYEIFEGRSDGGRMALQPAALEDGYYPIEHFEKEKPMADVGEDINPRISTNRYEYIGPREEQE